MDITKQGTNGTGRQQKLSSRLNQSSISCNRNLHSANRWYKYDFAEQDFFDLRKILQGIEGKLPMTINETPEIRDIFGCFSIEESNLRFSYRSSAKGRAKLRTELQIKLGF